MIRLRNENINTPDWFDHVWKLENVHRYDAVRLRQFLQDVKPAETVLDVGAGWWGIAQYATRYEYPGRYTALDFSEEARRRTLEFTPELDYRIGDALRTPFPDGSFDRVCCGELIEHMESPAELVAELFRVCRVGGRVIVGTLIAECEAAKAHGDYPEHLWVFTPDDLVQVMMPHAESPRYWECPGGQYHFVEGVKVAEQEGDM